MGNWQTIETAPKDGTQILAWDGTEMFVTCWVCKCEVWYNSMQRAASCYPTHWMPLPPPPKEK